MKQSALLPIENIKPIASGQAIETISAIFIVLFIISIYVSTLFTTIFSVVLGLLWLASGQFKKLPTIFKQSHVNTWALLLFLCLVIAAFYGVAGSTDANITLRKYREITYIPILSCFFTNEKHRNWAWGAFLCASIITLLASYLMHFKLLKLANYRSFAIKSRITHSIFIAFFVFYCLHKLIDTKKYRLWFLLFFVLGIYNLFVVTNGRTGQIICILLIPLFAFQCFKKKELILSFLAIIVCLFSFYHLSAKSNRLHATLDSFESYIILNQKVKYKGDVERITLWENAIKLVKEKPLLGHGTGSMKQEALRVSDQKLVNFENPHNEFLLITVQCGLVGLFVYLGFFYSQYRDALKLQTPEKKLAQGLLVTLIVTSCFNSPLLDFSEGHWFAVMIALCFSPMLTNPLQSKKNQA